MLVAARSSQDFACEPGPGGFPQVRRPAVSMVGRGPLVSVVRPWLIGPPVTGPSPIRAVVVNCTAPMRPPAARVVETSLAFRRGMSRSRPLPQLARRAAPARSVTDRACARSPALFLQRVQNNLMHNPVKKPDGHPCQLPALRQMSKTTVLS